MLVAWALFAFLTAAAFVTYSRIPAEELYNVGREGVVGGLSRSLVILNFPVSLAALGIVPLLLERGAPRVLGTAAIALCAVTAFPGVVDQGDLDARWINVVPALGVALAVVLTVRARPRLGLAPRQPLDRVRVVLAALVLVMSVPWFFAELGFYAPDPILADEPSPNEPIAAVHLGAHHGSAGAFLALAALALSRAARTQTSLLVLALMFAYGLANAVQDFWLEQVVKRGTVDSGLPSFVVPGPSIAWGLLIAGALLVFAALRWELSRAAAARGARAPAAGSEAAPGRP